MKIFEVDDRTTMLIDKDEIQNIKKYVPQALKMVLMN